MEKIDIFLASAASLAAGSIAVWLFLLIKDKRNSSSQINSSASVGDESAIASSTEKGILKGSNTSISPALNGANSTGANRSTSLPIVESRDHNTEIVPDEEPSDTCVTISELKERLRTISREQNLGRLTYKIVGSGCKELQLYFENYMAVGSYAFGNKCEENSQILNSLHRYFSNKRRHEISFTAYTSQLVSKGGFLQIQFHESDLASIAEAARQLTENF